MQARINLSNDVQEAIDNHAPLVALESTVISHGLPWPQNLELAQELEDIVREHGAIPATIALIDGVPHAGLEAEHLVKLADGSIHVEKISRRDFGVAMARRWYGATTVAATMIVAHKVGIPVFATGGVGGVHRGDALDVSADLPELSQTPVAVVCAGVKSILDLPRTLEWLETAGVPVLGYQTAHFPAFYTRESGLQVPYHVEDAEDTAAILRAHWDFGLKSGALITVPIAEADEVPTDVVDAMIEQALSEAEAQGIVGKEITPFILQRLVEISDGKTLAANLALLKQNAAVAAQIAVALNQDSR